MDDARRCTGTSKRSQKRCKRAAILGGTVCSIHGGKSPRAVAAAAERVLDGQVRAELARLETDPVEDPLRELQRLAGQVLAWKDALGHRVNELTSIRYTSETGGEQLRAEVALFERAMDRCATVLTAMARLNIDERLARITERQIEVCYGALVAALGGIGLTVEQQREARALFARHLRAVPDL